MLLFRPTMLLSAAKRTVSSAAPRRPARRLVGTGNPSTANTAPAPAPLPPPARPVKRPASPATQPAKKVVAVATAVAPLAPPPRPTKKPMAVGTLPSPASSRPAKRPVTAPAAVTPPPASTPVVSTPRPTRKPAGQNGAPTPPASPRSIRRPAATAASVQTQTQTATAPPSPRVMKRSATVVATPPPSPTKPARRASAPVVASASPAPRPTKKLAVATQTPPPSMSTPHTPSVSRARSPPRKPGPKATSPTQALVPLAALSGPKAKCVGFLPDHREKVLQIFQHLADINKALDERYKANSYVVAVEKLKRNDYIYMNLPPNIMPPGVNDEERKRLIAKVKATSAIGDKLKAKIVEILTTGDLAELHSLQQMPAIRAVRELTQVHGVGPRTAVTFFKKHGLRTVEELKKRVEEQEARGGGGVKGGNGDKSIIQLTEAQRLGLKYHSDISQRIPHEEVRLHEAFLKLRLRKYLGKSYELVICGSYRRREATSGDIDVLITRKIASDDGPAPQNTEGEAGKDKDNSGKDGKPLEPQEVLAAFVSALKEEQYIEATLAQGATKFMGVSRLKSYKYSAGTANPKMYPARRLDIRFVEPECFPAAVLYFTGSKDFNVVMRVEAIKRNFILNEYGLFRNEITGNETTPPFVGGGKGTVDGSERGPIRGRWSAEAFQKLVRANYYSAKSPVLSDTAEGEEAEADKEGEGVGGKGSGSASRKQKQQQAKELAALWREVEARRVKVKHEREIFAALGMAYVLPEKRNVGQKMDKGLAGAKKRRTR